MMIYWSLDAAMAVADLLDRRFEAAIEQLGCKARLGCDHLISLEGCVVDQAVNVQGHLAAVQGIPVALQGIPAPAQGAFTAVQGIWAAAKAIPAKPLGTFAGISRGGCTATEAA